MPARLLQLRQLLRALEEREYPRSIGENSCPLGFYSSGNYCVSSPSNNREAIQKQGNSCPLGWYSSGSYCVKSR